MLLPSVLSARAGSPSTLLREAVMLWAILAGTALPAPASALALPRRGPGCAVPAFAAPASPVTTALQPMLSVLLWGRQETFCCLVSCVTLCCLKVALHSAE